MNSSTVDGAAIFRRPAESRYLENPRGFRQHYLDWPGAALPVVLLHPKRSSARHWDHMVDALDSPNRVVAPDGRGHGLSDYPKDGYTVPELGQDVVAFLDALRIPRAYFVGGATGGNLCVWLAATCPDRVAGIAGVDPGMSVPKHIADEVIRQTREEHDFPDFETAKATMHFHDLWPPAVYDHYASHSFRERDDGRWEWRYAAEAARLIAHSLDADPVWDMAAAVRCPTVLVRGATSAVFTEDHMARLVGLIPQARVVHLKDAEHTPAQENPEGMAAEVDALIAAG
ncbi:MAG: alpha/beta hydrolase [Proteobacteria bacterium]|nr:alpha/beta hydrolase [Pseudomonadota bacterium]